MLLKLLLWYIKYEHRVTLKSQEYYRSISVTLGANKVIHYEAAQHAGPVKNIIIYCSDIIWALKDHDKSQLSTCTKCSTPIMTGHVHTQENSPAFSEFLQQFVCLTKPSSRLLSRPSAWCEGPTDGDNFW